MTNAQYGQSVEYHRLLNLLCQELGVPGCPSFDEALAWAKARMAQAQPVRDHGEVLSQPAEDMTPLIQALRQAVMLAIAAHQSTEPSEVDAAVEDAIGRTLFTFPTRGDREHLRRSHGIEAAPAQQPPAVLPVETPPGERRYGPLPKPEQGELTVERIMAMEQPSPTAGPGQTLEMFVCPDCGAGVAADEDGCCAMCGADTTIAPAAPPPSTGEPAGEVVRSGCANNNCGRSADDTCHGYGPGAHDFISYPQPAAAPPRKTPWELARETAKRILMDVGLPQLIPGDSASRYRKENAHGFNSVVSTIAALITADRGAK
jgi:hypothetical protein